MPTNDRKSKGLTGHRGATNVGDYHREQVTAIKLGRRLGERIAADHPHVANEYRAGRSYPEIAATIAGLAAAAQSSRIAAGAVAYAVSMLLGPDERRRLGPQHRRAALERTAGGFGTPAGRAFSSQAGRRNIELHGVDPDRLTRAKGYEPWGEAELATLLERLLPDPAYRHSRGAGKGWPRYAVIAEVLNREHHGGKAVRNTGSVKGMLARTLGRRLEPLR